MSARPRPVVALNRAIAIAQHEGPERGLEVIGASEDRARLAGYPFYPAALGELEIAVGNTTRRASTSVRRWRWPATRWSGSSSNSALARASEAIRHSRQFWNQQLVCREKSQAEKRRPDFIRCILPTFPYRTACKLMARKNCPPSPSSNVLKAGGRFSWRINPMQPPCYCFALASSQCRSP